MHRDGVDRRVGSRNIFFTKRLRTAIPVAIRFVVLLQIDIYALTIQPDQLTGSNPIANKGTVTGVGGRHIHHGGNHLCLLRQHCQSASNWTGSDTLVWPVTIFP